MNAAIHNLRQMPPAEMLAPRTDDPEREWCYLARSTVVIGLPFQEDVTQVTYDGALFTRNAELSFYCGAARQDLLMRQKCFLDGYIPIVQYAWHDGTVVYRYEAFGSVLADGREVNLVRIGMTNTGDAPRQVDFGARLGYSRKAFRFLSDEPDRNWVYELAGNCICRDGKPLLLFDSRCHAEIVNASPQRAEQLAAELHFSSMLDAGADDSLVFVMFRVPQDAPVPTPAAVDYEFHREKTVKYWRNMLGKCRLELPEKRVNDSFPASMAHTLLATRRRNGRKIQTDGIAYPNFFLTGAPQEGMLYLTGGHFRLCRDLIVRRAVEQQDPNGLYLDHSLAHGDGIPAAHGHVLYIVAMYVLYDGAADFGRRVFASVVRAVDYIRHSVQSDAYGLMHPTYPYDNEMIDGHYASNNFWALLGLRFAIRLARFLKEESMAADWTELEKRYTANILFAIRRSVTPEGYLPPGLYAYLVGPQARRNFMDYQTDCDWENMLLAYPGEILPPAHRIVRNTVREITRSYAEGVMTYRHGQHLHQYITANQIEQYVVMGESYKALRDFYHIVLHAGSAHECFENLVLPWTNRDVDCECPPPHAWASAKLGVLIRNFLLLEYGGNCGVEEDKRELWLFHCLAPEWLKPDAPLKIIHAPTEFGTVSATMRTRNGGATITVKRQAGRAFAAFRFRVPYFKKLRSFQVDHGFCRREKDCLVFAPEVTRLEVECSDAGGAKPRVFQDLLLNYRSTRRFCGVDANGAAVVAEPDTPTLSAEEDAMYQEQPLSFELVKTAFEHEYRRRFEANAAAGGSTLTVTPPRWER